MSKKGTSTSGNRNMLKSASAVYALLVTMALPASEYVPSEHTAMKTGVLKRATPKSAPTFCDFHTNPTSRFRIARTRCANVFSHA